MPTRVQYPRHAKFPPSGGEGRLCCTIFIALVLAILSCVTIIYSTAIIYLPSIKVLESNLQGPMTCTTTKTEMNVTGLKVSFLPMGAHLGPLCSFF